MSDGHISLIVPGDEFGKCARCQKQFVPEWMEALGCFSRCCQSCQLKNLLDAGLAESLDDYKKFGVTPDEFSAENIENRKAEDALWNDSK